MAENRPLQKWRKGQGISRQALAKALGVTEVTVGRWETGTRTPRKQFVPKLVDMTGLAPAAILGIELSAEVAE